MPQSPDVPISEGDDETHMNAESITSRIGPLNEQSLSPSRRGSLEPDIQPTESDPSSSVAVVELDLGYAAAFDSRIFPAEYYAEDNNLDKGIVLIKATLKEMEKIRDLGIDLNENQDFIFNTRLELEGLREREEKLVNNRKTLNPLKVFRNYKAARDLHEASKSLYLDTKSTSEKFHREVKSIKVVPGTQMRRVVGKSGPIPQGVKIGGIAIGLPDGFNKNVERTISDARDTIAGSQVDPFQDNTFVSQLRDDEQAISLANTESILSQDDEEDDGNRPTVSFGDPRHAPLTGHKTVNHITINNGVIASNSYLGALTNNHRSRESRGATITQGPAP